MSVSVGLGVKLFQDKTLPIIIKRHCEAFSMDSGLGKAVAIS
ncbi:hypothetical protein BH23BAC1_BH23BAC1_50810 [soil metagenome]